MNYFRQVEADDGFAAAQTTARHIWSVIDSAEHGTIVPVGAVHIAAGTPAREGSAATGRESTVNSPPSRPLNCQALTTCAPSPPATPSDC